MADCHWQIAGSLADCRMDHWQIAGTEIESAESMSQEEEMDHWQIAGKKAQKERNKEATKEMM